MAGLGPLTDSGYFYYQLGMAPAGQLTSVAIATDWVGTNGQFDISTSTFVYGYKTVMQDGVSRDLAPGISIVRPVDVVNSSWGFEDPTGSQQPTMILDALTFANHQTVCIAAGNHDDTQGPALVGGPASGFNDISVGALTGDLTVPKYGGMAPFSDTGPNDFLNPVTGEVIHGVRAAVSISAPGTDLILPAYVGATGTNQSGTLFDLTGIDPSEYSQLYFIGVAGTSFASPLTAGGAALIVDAGYTNFGGGVSIDGRVVKAVLLNSADKIPGWNNNTVNKNGVLFTAQGLDFNSGAGALDLSRAYDQYLSGTTNTPALTGGTVQRLGWAFGHVASPTNNDYIIDAPIFKGEKFTATLDWFIPVFFDSTATPDPITDNLSSDALHAEYFDQLDLQVWLVENGILTKLIAESTSPYNNVDHLYFDIPDDGMYAIRVSYLGTTYDLDGTSPHADDYGLAWSVDAVPEPASALLFLSSLPLLLKRRRRSL
jgi:hypothetical protein